MREDGNYDKSKPSIAGNAANSTETEGSRGSGGGERSTDIEKDQDDILSG